jgi:cytochrome d ubiquinol oxidase subunit I
MKTIDANSPSVSATEVWISLIGFVLIFIALGAADLALMLRYARKGLGNEGAPAEATAAADGSRTIPALTY